MDAITLIDEAPMLSSIHTVMDLMIPFLVIASFPWANLDFLTAAGHTGHEESQIFKSSTLERQTRTLEMRKMGDFAKQMSHCQSLQGCSGKVRRVRNFERVIRKVHNEFDNFTVRVNSCR